MNDLRRLSQSPSHPRQPGIVKHGQRAALALTSLSALLAATLLAGCGDSSLTTGGGAVSQVQHVTSNGAALKMSQMSFPDGFMTSVKSYGAVGDGITDDTAAIQSALADGRTNASGDYYGKPKALFFPAGTYLVRDTLKWVGCCVTLQGTGPGTSIIRLAPGSVGFNDPANPKPLILTPAGNTSFHQNIWDLGFAISDGNPGATALNYISNNAGSVHDVLISSDDGTGHAGLDLTRQYAGPLMIRDTEIRGFDVGVDLANGEYSSTFEGITVQNQNIAGIRNLNQPIAIRGFSSSNTVPALTNSGGFVVLLDAYLSGGSKAYAAIQTNNNAYLRNVNTAGYKASLLNTMGGGSALTKGTIKELTIGAPQTLTGPLKQQSLDLPVEETPLFTSASLSDWAPFNPRWYGDTAGLQALLNSGKHTIYFPFGAYFSYNEAVVVVPDTVNRIVGFSSVLNGGGGLNGGGIRFVVNSNSSTPLIFDQFGYGLKVDHVGSRPIAIKDTAVNSYQTSPGAGDVFFEDDSIGSFTIQPGQKAFARQLDDEANATKISNLGGSFWVLGLKTEQAGTVIDTEAGGSTELLGAMIYPAANVPSTDAAFRSVDSDVSYIYIEPVYCAGCGYSTQISETRSGKTATMPSSSSNWYRMPLFIGYQ